MSSKERQQWIMDFIRSMNTPSVKMDKEEKRKLKKDYQEVMGTSLKDPDSYNKIVTRLNYEV